MNLLLLPPPPSESSLDTYKAAYGPALTSVFSQIAANARAKPLILDIALLLENLDSIETRPRSNTYRFTEKPLNALYTLICWVLAESVQGLAEEKVDFRAFLVHDQAGTQDLSKVAPEGPLIALKPLASAQRSWTDVFCLEGEHGEALLQKFVSYRKSLPRSRRSNMFNIHRTIGGTSLKLGPGRVPHTWDAAARKHFSIAVGGTFDHLHAGHKLLLTATALVLEPSRESAIPQERSLTIGITGDELLKNKKYVEVLESWETRQRAVINFLSALLDLNTPLEDIQIERFARAGPNGNAVHYRFNQNLTVKCVEISDPFGPTITEQTISALVVSGETRSGGQAVNDKRVEKGWEPLEVFEVDVLDSSPKDGVSIADRKDFQSKISSTEIRKRLSELR